MGKSLDISLPLLANVGLLFAVPIVPEIEVFFFCSLAFKSKEEVSKIQFCELSLADCIAAGGSWVLHTFFRQVHLIM